MDKKTLPFKLNIASPCHARWEDMGGSEQVRFCDHCRKNVYNLSAMSEAEAAALIETKKGQLCARFYQRTDGTVLTEDCPVGLARHWRRMKMLVAGGATAIVLVLINCAAFARGGEKDDSGDRVRGKFLTSLDNATDKVKNLINPKPVMLMGAIAMSVPPPTNAPLMGKIAIAPKTNTPAASTPPPAKK